MMVIFIALPNLISGTPLTIYTELSGSSQFFDESGVLTGSAVEIVQAIQEIIGDDTPIIVVPWARGYHALLEGPKVMLFSTTRTELREPLFHWVGPVLTVTWGFYSLKDAPIEINSLDDAKEVRAIGAYRNDVREQYLLEHGFTNLDSTTDNVLNVRKLSFGRIDLLISTDKGFPSLVESAGYSMDQFELQFVIPNVSSSLYLAFSKDTPLELIQRWEEGLRTLHELNHFKSIYEYWYPNNPIPEQVFQNRQE